jgi:choline dehydrogenase-like flavoprotein
VTMLIENLESHPAASRFEADVIIIGGGKAGLTLAREFMNSKTKVLILESGLELENIRHMELNRIESVGEPKGEVAVAFRASFHQHNMPTYDAEIQPYGIRSRTLGGCPYWGGKSAIFDEIDFAKRDWVSHSGWPINRDILEPYFRRAADLLNLGPNLYGEELWTLIGHKVKRPPVDKAKLHSFFWQFARSRLNHTKIMNLAEEFRIKSADNIRTLTNATVVHIDTDSTGTIFRGLEVSTIDGARSYVTGKLCVLAAGAIENARLLLISNREHKTGLGNAHDVVGRYLMDHPGTRIGYFKKEDAKAANYLGFYTIPYEGALIMYMHGLSFSPELQIREKLLNAAVYVLAEIARDDPFQSIKRLTKFKSTNYFADLWSLAESIGLLMKGVGLKIFHSKFFPAFLQKFVVDFFMAINPGFVVREFQSMGVPHKLDCMAIHVMTEQEPNPESRLVLSETKDVLGLPIASSLWKISEIDRRNVVRIGQLLLEELPKAGLPAPVMEEWIIGNRPHDAPLIDMAHMIGTTRMSDDPRFGVVDSQCQVHGVKGLYIVGSSVFPTSSHVNPTLMILSLAIRTADQLKKLLAEDLGSSEPALRRPVVTDLMAVCGPVDRESIQ